MSTNYVPTPTFGTAGNIYTPTSLAASPASVSNNVDVSAGFEMDLQCGNQGGATVAAGATVTVNVYRRIGSTPQADTVPTFTFTIATVASTPAFLSIALPVGRWSVKIINNDASNATTVGLTSDSYTVTGT